MYYVKVMTRGAHGPAGGSPAQAVAYLADGHDTRRDPSYSDPELRYIARLDPGWKADIEGGRIPLVGVGVLASISDQGELAHRFQSSCRALPDPRATEGYRCFTFSLPKEVSLFSNGRRQEATAAIYAAAQRALERVYRGKDITGVAAVHTRNTNGEIHFHLHVLVSKFAVERDTGQAFSLNSKRGGNTGQRQLGELKAAWKESVDREYRERFGLGIEQKRSNGPVTLVMPDGTRLEPLNRASRRELDRALSPRYAETTPAGAVVHRVLRLNVMDDRIFEIAVGNKGAGWSSATFHELFPELKRFDARYEKRVETLKAVGYLTADGRVSREFRVHHAVKHGDNTPELQQLRLDLARRATRPNLASGKASAPDFWATLGRYETLQRRISRLGYSREDMRRVLDAAEQRKPTPARLQALRLEAQRRALALPRPPLPQTKTVVRAFVELQVTRGKRVCLIVGGIATLNFRENKDLADKLLKAARRDLFYAKEKRLAQVGRGLRPVFWLVKVALPREARRLQKAMDRCARLARDQESRRIYRDEVGKAFQEWRRNFVERPLEQLKQQPVPPQEAQRLDAARARIDLGEIGRAKTQYLRGFGVLQRERPAEAAPLAAWRGREDVLVQQVFATAKGQPSDLPRDQYQAAVKAGRIGFLLEREASAPRPDIPKPFAESQPQLDRIAARLHAFSIKNPLTREALNATPRSQLDRMLRTCAKAGLLDDSPAWTLNAPAARELAAEMGKSIQKSLDADRLLIDQLINARDPKS